MVVILLTIGLTLIKQFHLKVILTQTIIMGPIITCCAFQTEKYHGRTFISRFRKIYAFIQD